MDNPLPESENIRNGEVKYGSMKSMYPIFSKQAILGIDLGGTTVTAGVVEGTEILGLHTIPTCNERPAADILESISGLISTLASDFNITAIGVGVPVPAGPETDILIPSENLPTMGNFPLKSLLEERFHLPVTLENDARCMALGEFRAGALQGYGNCVCLTVDTGLGCGIIINGELYRGSRYAAGEIWNIPLESGILLEESVSVGGLKALCLEISGEEIEPYVLHRRFIDGDPEAAEIFERYGEALGRATVIVLSLLDPEKIVLGGGIARSFKAFHGGLIRTMEKTWGKEGAEKIEPAALSERAAVLGAAELAGKSLNLDF
jgi:glucokinase